MFIYLSFSKFSFIQKDFGKFVGLLLLMCRNCSSAGFGKSCDIAIRLKTATHFLRLAH